jgi:DtxR family Mn-dependent transcriptional regulator
MGNNGSVSDLIDTTEMYLRTIYELVEEGIVPLRARIAERLHQSGPTVSQTVARMERDGLLTVEGDRHLQLTDEGNSLATRVMSETVERRLLELLDHPTESPYGNPIPGLAELGESDHGEQFRDGVEALTSVVGLESRRVRVRRISEEMQKDEVLMGALRRAGAIPGAVIAAVATPEGVLLGSSGETAEIVPEAAEHIFVTPA